MRTTTALFILVFVLLLTTGLPAAAASAPGKAYCKGANYTVTVTLDNGEQLSEAVYLDWRRLYSADNTNAIFKNQGQCVAHVNAGGLLYAPLCALLSKDGKVATGKCPDLSRRGDVILDDLTC